MAKTTLSNLEKFNLTNEATVLLGKAINGAPTSTHALYFLERLQKAAAEFAETIKNAAALAPDGETGEIVTVKETRRVKDADLEAQLLNHSAVSKALLQPIEGGAWAPIEDNTGKGYKS